MKKITWVKLSSKRYGGVIYGEKVRSILSEKYDLEVKQISSGHIGWKYLKPLEWFFGLSNLRENNDLWIRDDFYSIAFQFLNRVKGKKLAIVYHLDSSVFPLALRPFLFLLEKFFYFSVKKADAILTIADYWKSHFLKRGCQNVYKICPAFNLSDFNISDNEVEEFKKKYDLEGKPIIYIGNCQKPKGVVESYEALKDLDAYLVTSGEKMIKIPALNLNLDYRDYLKLLKASSIVVTMSKFKEGWCMTAHEAMLVKTPVIGSGKGGMRELLEGGKQVVCPDFYSLRKKVEYLLRHPEARKRMGEDGYNFAKNFTMEIFRENWLKLIRKLL